PSFVPPVDHPLLAEPLRETLGVVVFQDQVLEVAIALAGFTVGEAEGLRRAMSRKRSEEAIEAFRGRFVEGAGAKGVDAKTADGVYDKLVGFSGFGFPKSHAAAFGLLAYQSAWLRHHYPAEFLLALPLDPTAETPELPEPSEWERMLADYRQTSLSIGVHPMELLRSHLPEGVLSSHDLCLAPDRTRVAVAGMAVACQRPATANGV